MSAALSIARFRAHHNLLNVGVVYRLRIANHRHRGIVEDRVILQAGKTDAMDQ